MGFVLYVFKSCTLRPLALTQLIFLVKSSHPKNSSISKAKDMREIGYKDKGQDFETLGTELVNFKGKGHGYKDNGQFL
ncbi:hypothetical protein Hanom_Chr08g00705231 [Helianthus anomalus]